MLHKIPVLFIVLVFSVFSAACSQRGLQSWLTFCSDPVFIFSFCSYPFAKIHCFSSRDSGCRNVCPHWDAVRYLSVTCCWKWLWWDNGLRTCVAEVQVPVCTWARWPRQAAVGRNIVLAALPALPWRFNYCDRQHAYEFLRRCGGRCQELAGEASVTVACLQHTKLRVRYIIYESELVMNFKKESNFRCILHIFRLFCIHAKFAF